MIIEMEKDPHNFKMFWKLLKFDQSKIDNDDAKTLANGRICMRLREITKCRWMVKSCVGGKCVIGTAIVPNRNLRRKLKGKKIEIPDVPYFES